MSDDALDRAIRGYLTTAKMQQEMIPHMEEMAQKLAAAGVASNKVKGDSPEYAIDRWCDVIRRRAKELLREKLKEQPASPMIENMKQLKHER